MRVVLKIALLITITNFKEHSLKLVIKYCYQLHVNQDVLKDSKLISSIEELFTSAELSSVMHISVL